MATGYIKNNVFAITHMQVNVEPGEMSLKKEWKVITPPCHNFNYGYLHCRWISGMNK